MCQWRAEFRDSSILCQFDGEKETMFLRVLERQEDLVRFSLIDGTQECAINFIDGSFALIKENVSIPIVPVDTEKVKLTGLKFKIIYFQRKVFLFNANFGPAGEDTLFVAAGWETVFEGKVIKRYIKMHSSGLLEFVTE